VSDCARGFGWWQAANGKWYPPGYRPDPAAEPPVPDPAPTTTFGAPPVVPEGGSIEKDPEPVPSAPWPPVRRKPAFRLGSDLDRGVWMWLLVIGAIALIALVIVVASQIPSVPKKGASPKAAIEQVGPVRPGPVPFVAVDHWRLGSRT